MRRRADGRVGPPDGCPVIASEATPVRRPTEPVETTHGEHVRRFVDGLPRPAFLLARDPLSGRLRLVQANHPAVLRFGDPDTRCWSGDDVHDALVGEHPGLAAAMEEGRPVVTRWDGETLELWPLDADGALWAATTARPETEPDAGAAEPGSFASYEVDVATGRHSWSDEARAVLGLPAGAEPSSEAFWRLIHPEDVPGFVEARSRLRSSGVAVRHEHRIIRPDGGIRWVRHQAAVVPDDPGGGVRLVGTLRDVTDERLRSRRRADRDRRLHALLRQSSELLVGWDAEGVVCEVNPAAETALGASADQLVGRSIGSLLDLSDVEPESSTPGEVRLRTVDGTPRWALGQVVTTGRRSTLLARDITARKHLEARLRRAATTDETTGLPNRERLRAWLDEQSSRAEPFALLVVGADRFSTINDIFGYPRGDDALRAIGRRLVDLAGDDGFVARLGGDTFAVGLPRNPTRALDTAEWIRGAFEQPIRVPAGSLHVDVSIGLARFPDHATDAQELVRRAERAMRMAKERSSDLEVYDPEFERVTAEHLELLAELPDAIRLGQLEMFHQPQVDPATGRVVGSEALIRWRHPTRGLLVPGRFIPLAEQSGLIRPLTRWTVEEAMRQRHRWVQQGLELRVSVNVTARNLRDPGFVDALRVCCGRWQVPPSGLTLEITERTLIEDFELAARMCAELRRAGIGIALDDFGVGASSLEYLDRLPTDEIKIDRLFVARLDEPGRAITILSAIVAGARIMGRRVVAEGVETAHALERLRDLGCDAVQGYHLARPMPADELPDWVRAHDDRWARG